MTGSSRPRESMELGRSEIISTLKSTASDKTIGAPLLRIYWYDGLLHGRPSAEQESLASMDNVKVRLGTVTAGRQKGVDSLIVTDLIELARNHAISDAVLLSGDEDLRIGVQIAQGFGVRVHLIGIEPSRGNQSYLLRQEADTTTEWSKRDIGQLLSVKSSAYTNPQDAISSSSDEENTDEILDGIIADIAGSLSENERAGIVVALSQKPQDVPHDFDRKLLSRGRTKIGRDLSQIEKARLRDKFKENLRGNT